MAEGQSQPTANVSGSVSPAKEPEVSMPDGGKRKRYIRAQTGKDRREYVKRKIKERSEEVTDSTTRDRPESSEPRLPKRRAALLIGFCGSDYQGMQANEGARTIEGELFKALCEAGAVSADNSTDQKKVQLQRAARTDKGVHAAGQVVSLKMIIEDPMIVEKINQHLPDQIRVWGFVRVVRSFNAKTMCDSRVYEYLLPTYTFMEPSKKCMELARTVPFEEREIPVSSDEEIQRKRDYRAPKEVLEFVKDAFGKYKGTHDFRNFTVTKGCTENNSKRYIHWFDVSEPMIINGSEWLSLKVKGQSFMLHQIRKMVGLVILMVRAGAPLSLMDKLFGGPRVNVPKAPGLGLLLERPVFDGYNKRPDSDKPGSSGKVSFEPFEKEIGEFRQKFIYDTITKTELDEAVFDNWVMSTEVFPEQYTYINKEGIIPESAIVVPGQEARPRPRRLNASISAPTADKETVESSEDEQDSNDL
ncbi:pseudouridine synthase [Coemansia reversa NRRL 1564]|uniref:tRNA pseudouridine synthase 1 n=1 Tax=Coemansia reversa (strain ATCC 12441 / NRRL 1564) TaxID=763665 RepID=A0A2G5BGZ0_COERN|nr:pseudouridine synthase [Coemansia reversa NRRL 1564]|eukprot:PIA17987.1 pseudouridine synthase [Coemansia reversa NRRL 1564]